MAETQLIRCPSCGATNRVPQHKVESGLQPLCGRCTTPLSADHRPVTVTDATIAPVLDELASEMAGRVRFAKLNVDENPATAARFRVNSIPTLLVFKGGREVDRLVGVQSKPEIKRRLERVTG